MSGSAGRLAALLADGALHSGGCLAAELGMTRSAVWKIVADLRARGIAVESVERRGYRLPRPVELLDDASLRAAASLHGIALPAATEVHFQIESTKEYLHDAPAPRTGEPRLVFAELQTAGRGRRGRSWVAPFGSGLTFSIGWAFADLPADLPALSLAMGVCVARELHGLGAPRVLLKWPNDIVFEHRKLGGLLAQMRAEAGGPAYVVVGLGLNLELPAAARSQFAAAGATPVADLAEACTGPLPSRARVAVRVAGAMLGGLAEFARSGFATFASDWAALDSLRDAPVTVVRQDGSRDGIARGADTEGALLVETSRGLERVHAGDVSLRRVEPAREPGA
jgi:BirA family biotin operon repressor/biotin-[acetyl-CoA-carboxylase] ligase